MRQITCLCLFLIVAWTGTQIKCQKVSSGFLSRFHKIVDDWSSHDQPNQAVVSQGSFQAIMPEMDQNTFMNAFLEAKKEFEEKYGEINMEKFPESHQFEDSNAHEKQFKVKNNEFPVAEFVSHAASSSSNRLSNFISQAPLAKAVSNSSSKIIDKAKQSANAFNEYLAANEFVVSDPLNLA